MHVASQLTECIAPIAWRPRARTPWSQPVPDRPEYVDTAARRSWSRIAQFRSRLSSAALQILPDCCGAKRICGIGPSAFCRLHCLQTRHLVCGTASAYPLPGYNASRLGRHRGQSKIFVSVGRAPDTGRWKDAVVPVLGAQRPREVLYHNDERHAEFIHHFLGYADYADKHTLDRFDILDYYTHKFMIYHLLAHTRPNVWTGYLDGCEMQP